LGEGVALNDDFGVGDKGSVRGLGEELGRSLDSIGDLLGDSLVGGNLER
jgi:hypothetical protein